MDTYTHKFEPESSSISTIFYNTYTKDLAVRFVNGNLAAYRNVSPFVYGQFAGSASAGRYYNSNIKGVFSGTSILTEPVESSISSSTLSRYAQPTAPKTDKFKVTINVSGDVEIEVAAINFAEAIAEAEKKVKEAFGLPVTIDIKGVNKV